ncbi:hypothetical protein [Abyssalbus ytuae]|uniref:Uncharacterized protein n=1 Tax=Abyssalbus ytuae TaxID=2926907 RepID=A0A9E7CTU5_9FLAO|nr:hypothetical protein [Abyssalbus ytuae]UOB16827.1 hypothetical protein MQE35_13915 [Abyssalbus ytuae]
METIKQHLELEVQKSAKKALLNRSSGSYQAIVPFAEGMEIGKGFDWLDNAPCPSPFANVQIKEQDDQHYQQGTTQIINSEKELSDFLSMDTEFAGTGFGASVSASASFMEKRETSSTSVHLLVSKYIHSGGSNLVNQSLELNSRAKKLLKEEGDIDEFLNLYGRQAIIGFIKGGSLNIDIRIKAESESSAKKVAGELELIYSGLETSAEARAKFKQQMSSNQQRFEVDINHQSFGSKLSLDLSDFMNYEKIMNERKKFDEDVLQEGGSNMVAIVTPWSSFDEILLLLDKAKRKEFKEKCKPPRLQVIQKFSSFIGQRKHVNNSRKQLEASETRYGVPLDPKEIETVDSYLSNVSKELAQIETWEALQKTDTDSPHFSKAESFLKKAIHNISRLYNKVSPPSQTRGVTIGSPTWGENPGKTAKMAKAQISSDDLKKAAIAKVKEMKKAYGNGVSTLIIVYNVTGTWLRYIADRNSSGHMWNNGSYPDVILPGQAGVFLHTKTAGAMRGSIAVTLYELRDPSLHIRDVSIGWNTPYSGANGVHTKFWESGKVNDIKNLLEKDVEGKKGNDTYEGYEMKASAFTNNESSPLDTFTIEWH